jgi:hypothetical protein
MCSACGKARQDSGVAPLIAVPPHHQSMTRVPELLPQVPTRGCCARCCLGVSGVALLFLTVPFMLAELIAAPLFFVATAILKVTCCKYCCSESCNSTTKNFVKTPCRWMMICWTGRGSVGCWDSKHEPLPQNAISQQKIVNAV